MTVADDSKKISVRIGGMNYQLVSAEDEKYTRQVAARADEMIRRAMQANPQLTHNMASILALVNVLDEMTRFRQQYSAMEDQRLQHDRQLAETRSELARMREQNWEMKKEILRLNELCRDYEALLQVSEYAGKSAAEPEETPAAAEPATAVPATAVPATEVPVIAVPAMDSSPRPPASNDPEPLADPADMAGQQLKQTNLEDYLRENGWPQPIEPKQYEI